MWYEIQGTLDPELCRLGVRHKLVQRNGPKPDKVVGFFSDWEMARMVRETLNQAAGYCD